MDPLKKRKMKTPMKPEVIRAIKASIAHWKRLQVFKQRKGEDTSSDSCPLCKLFHDGINICANCPVARKAGASIRQNTPWSRASRAWNTCATARHMEDRKPTAGELGVLHRAAEDEISFLTRLLPREHRPTKKKP